MRARLVAAAAGTLVVAYVTLAYSFGSFPVIAGTNAVEPLYGVFTVPAHSRLCQSLPDVPPDATYLRMAVDSQPRGRGVIKAVVRAPNGLFARGTARDLQHGLFAFGLSQRTIEARRGSLCIANVGPVTVRLSGELKRIRGREKTRPVGIASVAFLASHSTTLFARARAIARHFGEAQVGTVGTWALLAAALFMVAAWGTAMWWVVTKPGEDG